LLLFEAIQNPIACPAKFGSYWCSGFWED